MAGKFDLNNSIHEEETSNAIELGLIEFLLEWSGLVSYASWIHETYNYELLIIKLQFGNGIKSCGLESIVQKVVRLL